MEFIQKTCNVQNNNLSNLCTKWYHLWESYSENVMSYVYVHGENKRCILYFKEFTRSKTMEDTLSIYVCMIPNAHIHRIC